MGQYYKPISLDKGEYLLSHDYGNGLKLMEHSYVGNDFVETVEALLQPGSTWHKTRIVWAGDYADAEEKGTEFVKHLDFSIEEFPITLYSLCDDIFRKINPTEKVSLRFIVNHTKKEYVDKEALKPFDGDWYVHPLPLLTCEGNGRGGGDFRGENDSVGAWSRDMISMESEVPADYVELRPNFEE